MMDVRPRGRTIYVGYSSIDMVALPTQLHLHKFYGLALLSIVLLAQFAYGSEILWLVATQLEG